MWHRVSVGLAVLVVLASGAACVGDDDARGGSVGDPTGTILVFAAASLTDAFAQIATAFEAAHPAVDVQLNLGGSSSLRQQILEGAPADVFASANQSTMDDMIDAGEVEGAAPVFARNRLQIAVPAGNPAGVAGLEDFARDDLLIGLCTEGVPCGDLARRALADAGVEASIDTNEPDVRALLTKIGADELDAGLVYVTDVTAAAGAVDGIDIAAGADVVATYPIASLVDASDPAAAEAFVDFVLSEQGRSILSSFGFAAP